MKYLFASLFHPYEFPPIGLAYVAAALRHTGRNVIGFKPAQMDDQMESLTQKISEESVDVVCFGELSAFFPVLRRAIATVREHFPSVKIIVGGGIITAEPEFIVEHLDMDFGCVGYGEETICEFADCLESGGDFSKIKGLIYKDTNGRMIINPPRSEPDDLDSIPFPAYELFGWRGGKNHELIIVGSRSCPYKCTFCFHPSGYVYKQRSIDNIFAEIEYWREKFKFKVHCMLDELIGLKKERILEFCRRFKEYSVPFTLSLHANMISDGLGSVLADAGCITVTMGLESMCQTVLDSIGKKTTTQQIEKALAVLSKYRIGLNCNLMFGDPVETYDMARETLNWWFKHHEYSISVSLVIPYPGTELYKYGLSTGRITDRRKFLEHGCPPLNLSVMTDVEYEKLRDEIYYLNNLRGEPVASIQIESNAHGAVAFYGICPQCGRNSLLAIGNSIKTLAYSHFPCVCAQRMRLPSEYRAMLQQDIYFDLFDFVGKKVAVWGASPQAKFRLAANPRMKKAVSVVIDRNHEKFERFLGFDVISPNSLSASDFDVLYIGTRLRQQVLDTARSIIGDEMNKKEIIPII